MKRTAKLTFETERVLVIRGHRGPPQLLCEACGETIHFLTAPEAAALAGTGQRTIYRMVEAGKLHFIETADGALLICCNSLGAQLLHASAPSLKRSSKGEGKNHES